MQQIKSTKIKKSRPPGLIDGRMMMKLREIKLLLLLI